MIGFSDRTEFCEFGEIEVKSIRQKSIEIAGVCGGGFARAVDGSDSDFGTSLGNVNRNTP